MKFAMRLAVLALGGAAPFCPRAGRASTSPTANPGALALVSRALADSDIFDKSGPAFRLRARFRIASGSGKYLEGEWLEIRTPAGWWHEEQQMPGYQNLEVSDGQKIWSAEVPGYVPFPIFLVGQALDLAGRLRAARGKDLGAPATSPDGFGQCVETTGDAETFEYCFDPQSGNLVRLLDGFWNVTFEYAAYGPFGAKKFPRVVRVLETSGALLAEIHVDLLAPEPDPSLSTFLPVPGSREWPVPTGCPSLDEPSLKKMVQPKYPEAAAKAGLVGMVRLYAEIGPDGIPRGLWPINSAPPVLSQAAIGAVSQWRYRPQTCRPTGETMPAFLRITAMFVSR